MRKFRHEVAELLAVTYNHHLTTSCVVKDCMCGKQNMTSIFRRLSKRNAENYRVQSLTHVQGKTVKTS